MNFNEIEFTLLTWEQVFGKEKIDVVEKFGGCQLTDLALLLGARHLDTNYDGTVSKGAWYLSSPNMYGDVCAVSRYSHDTCCEASERYDGIRPVLPYSNITDIFPNGVEERRINGLLEVEYGEYPQYAAPSKINKILDTELSANNLRRTGKIYKFNLNNFIQCEEFEYDGRRYANVKMQPCFPKKLSNGCCYFSEDCVWLEVVPIKWLVDEKAKLLVSKRLLASGIRFCNDKTYRGDFKNTKMYRFLNEYFAKDIVPSTNYEMSETTKQISNDIGYSLNNEFKLLSLGQVFGKQRIDVIKKTESKCAVTDFAILLGCCAFNYNRVFSDNSLKGRTGMWYTFSSVGDGNVYSFNEFGNVDFCYTSKRDVGIRPVLSFDKLDLSVTKETNGLLEVDYGEYPQYAVNKNLSGILESEFLAGKLIKTGKTYTTDSKRWNESWEDFTPKKHEEFEYNEKKYVRVKSNFYGRFTDRTFLSNGECVMPNDIVWLEVSPIKWYIDEKEKLLVSKRILASGVRFCDGRRYDGDFKSTEMYMFLNKYFSKDIIPSNNYKMIIKSNRSIKEKNISYEKEKEEILKKVRENSEIYKKIEGKYRNDLDIALEAVIMDGLLLEFVTEKLKNDVKIVKLALESNPMALKFAGSTFKNDFDTVMYCVKRCGMTLKYASPNMRRNSEIVLEAVRQNDLAIEFANPELFEEKQNKNIVLEAVAKNGRNLKFFNQFKDDRDVVLTAVKQNGVSIAFADSKYFDDEEIVLIVLSQPECRYLINFISERLYDDIEFMKKLMQIDRNYLKYASSEVKDLLRIELLKLAADSLYIENKVKIR